MNLKPKLMMLKMLITGVIFMNLLLTVNAVEWQWAVDTGAKKTGKAYLWIPPDCEYVRGVVVCQQVILEAQVVNDPIIREALAKENLALIHIVPSMFGYEDFDPSLKGTERFQEVLDKLAEVSGYSEISQAPSCWLGHSGGSLWSWNYAWWHPDRCFGVISLHAAPSSNPPTYKGKEKNAPKPNIDYVPILDISGQYECPGEVERTIEWHWKWCRGGLLSMRGVNKFSYVSLLVGPGVSHFGWDEAHAKYVGMFIKKAAHYRIPAERPEAGKLPKLINLPKTSGALTDITIMTPPVYPTAAYNRFTGDPTLAMWHLDEELAKANDDFMAESKGKKVQLVSFVEDGKLLPNSWIQGLKFSPEDDGLTIKVKADFVSEVPPGLGYPGLSRIGHAEGPIKYRLFGGWSGGGEQTGPDIFRIKFDRVSITKGAGGLMVMAYHPGDKDYAYCEQPCSINFPGKNTKGKPQKITFVPIPNQKPDAAEIKLEATSDSGLPVEFCVMAGSAEIKDGKLVLTKIPPRAKFPVKVSVVAYQWGRSIEPLVQTADYVEQSFLIER